jgi:hypothetical protein
MRVDSAADASLQAVLTTLGAWIEAGHRVGDESAGLRRVLMDAAMAVDRARAGTQVPRTCPGCGDPIPGSAQGSPYTLSMAARTLADILGSAAPPLVPQVEEEPDDDVVDVDLDDWLAAPEAGDTAPSGH